MLVTLDGVTLALDHPTVRTALEAGIAAAEAKGAMIVGVLGDNQELAQELLQEPPDTPGSPPHFAHLAMSSVRPADLVARTLRDAAAAVDGLIASQQHAAAAIQEGKLQEGLVSLQEIFSTWQLVRDVISQGASVLKRDLTQLATLPGIDGNKPVQLCLNALVHTLREVKTSIDSEDWSALCDHVGFTLDAMAKDWKVVLGALADYVEASFVGPSAIKGTP